MLVNTIWEKWSVTAGETEGRIRGASLIMHFYCNNLLIIQIRPRKIVFGAV